MDCGSFLFLEAPLDFAAGGVVCFEKSFLYGEQEMLTGDGERWVWKRALATGFRVAVGKTSLI